MDKDRFRKRLITLRMRAGISAREMSLSIGQNPGYINNIECGISFPAMQNFFYICEYLHVTPQQFFDTETEHPAKVDELVKVVQGLAADQLDNLIAIAKGLQKK